MNTDMRRLVDSPTDQDVDALRQIDNKDICSICGGPNGTIWLHCDSWTKWLRLGCGCNVMHCENCKEAASAKRKELVAANRTKAEAAEVEILKNINPGQLARLRYRYYDSFNCSDEFRDWGQSVVGEERMRELLDVPCDNCARILGQPRWTFEDKDGNSHLWTLDEVEIYCYQATGRDPVTQPFVTERESMSEDLRSGGGVNRDKAAIGFQSAIWDYFERQGWSHDRDADEDRKHFNEAFQATRGPDCGGDNFWSYAYFLYYMPTRTFLGKLAKRGGDWPQIVQINRKQLDQERAELRERFGEEYHKNPEFWPLYSAIDEKQEWKYFCGMACCEAYTPEKGTLFI